MKCKFCGAEVRVNEKCEYCGSVAEPEYYGLKRGQERKANLQKEERREEERWREPDGTYKVRRGDTLWGIAKTFYGSGAEYKRIVRKNKIKNPNLIYPGQILEI